MLLKDLKLTNEVIAKNAQLYDDGKVLGITFNLNDKLNSFNCKACIEDNMLKFIIEDEEQNLDTDVVIGNIIRVYNKKSLSIKTDDSKHFALIISDKENYVGEIKNNRKEGSGIMINEDGDKYEGKYKNDKMNGKGKYYYANGSCYNGMWKDDYREGVGHLKYNSGSWYFGRWEKDKMNGIGEFECDNYHYNGEWKNGKKNGKGVIKIAPHGDECHGLWENNVLISDKNKKDNQSIIYIRHSDGNNDSIAPYLLYQNVLVVDGSLDGSFEKVQNSVFNKKVIEQNNYKLRIAINTHSSKMGEMTNEDWIKEEMEKFVQAIVEYNKDKIQEDKIKKIDLKHFSCYGGNFIAKDDNKKWLIDITKRTRCILKFTHNPENQTLLVATNGKFAPSYNHENSSIKTHKKIFFPNQDDLDSKLKEYIATELCKAEEKGYIKKENTAKDFDLLEIIETKEGMQNFMDNKKPSPSPLVKNIINASNTNHHFK